MPKVKKLNIYYNDVNGERQIRYTANRWQWQDSVMGEQYITLNAQSDVPIPFAIGDYCIYRGETYYLNYIPSETQNARPNSVGNGFVYENMKFDSCQEELSRCQMRDITPTTGLYVSSLGTNHTGSTNFSLYCGEIVKNGKIYTPVCALAAKMQANLDEMYRDKDGNPMWRIIVNTTTSHEEFGVQVYDTHTDEKVLSFSNNFVSEALAMVYNEFKLNYCVKGRTVYIGYELGDLTNYDPTDPTLAVDDDTKFSFGYGKGNPSKDNPNTGLFQLKKIANSSQMIITRLRAFGSKKNMPYRYYNKKFGLSQSLFPVNLMLPDTFQSPTGKNAGNIARRDILGDEILDVMGDSNDSYIEKDNNAQATTEGIREGSAFWDGSDSNLEEIYPTIEGVTYAELRSAGIPDQNGTTGALAFPGYEANERIDEILDICSDTNIGNGINYDQATNSKYMAVKYQAGIPYPTDETGSGKKFVKRKIAEFKEISAGRYILTQTTQAVNICPILVSCDGTGDAKAYYEIIVTIIPNDGSAATIKTIITRNISFRNIGKWSNGRWTSEVYIDKIPFPTIENTEDLIEVKSSSTVTIECQLKFSSGSLPSTAPDGHPSYFGWELSNNIDDSLTETPNLDGYLILALEGAGDTYQETPFHVIIKDIGFNITASFYDGDEHVIAMKSGNCVARQFTIGESIEKVEVDHNGTKVKGYKIYLTNREIDDTLNTFYPSTKDPIGAGDRYVLLGIEMPDVFVRAAEVRLLKAACKYLKENCTTRFTYQPYLDDLFIERDYDRNIERETPEKSIYWRLYAGLKFTFRNIPKYDDLEVVETLSLMIQSITIREGERYTPQIEINLNDEVMQTTLQKIQTSVDKITHISTPATVSKGSSIQIIKSSDTIAPKDTNVLSALRSNKQFLRKDQDDTASGSITFKRRTHNQGGMVIGDYLGGLAGKGGMIDENANAELESLKTRGFIESPELRYNRISINVGVDWNTPCGGIIESVTPSSDGSETGQCVLKLEDGEYGAVKDGDLCMGIWHDEGGNETETVDDHKGNFKFAGFKTVYFHITSVSGANNNIITYLLRSKSDGGNGIHPFPGMHFAGRGSTTDTNRQGIKYATPLYSLSLMNVSTWEFQPENYYGLEGYVNNFVWHAVDEEGNTIEKIYNGYVKVMGQAYIYGKLDFFERQGYRMFIDQSKGGMLAPNESEEISVTIVNGYGTDVTGRFTNLTVTRNSGDEASDEAWNAEFINRHRDPDTGISIVPNPFTISFSDLGIDGIHRLMTVFRVVATDEDINISASQQLDYFS